MYSVRLWSVRRARTLETVYGVVEKLFLFLYPLLNAIGFERCEKPVAFVERNVKGFLFDCKMCGQCALSSTGMSCSMNCPKELRNGPCGGVRSNGHCEVKPEMRCVWVAAHSGSQKMKNGSQILNVQHVVDRRLLGRSSWLREVQQLKSQQLSK